jgi:hypothetical protein
MPIDFSTTMTIILGVAGVTMALVAPLYILVLRVYGGDEAAAQERETLDETQTDMEETLDRIDSRLETIETAVEINAERSETNQRHIHQLLVGKIEDDDSDIGNPHYQAQHCPLGEECTWHDSE